MKLFEILSAMKVLGPGHLLKMKKGHEQFLPHTRGLVLSQMLWALEDAGIIDRLSKKPGSAHDIAVDTETDEKILGMIFHYLEGIRFLKKENGRYSLDNMGVNYVKIGRGMVTLARGYQPFLENLGGLLKGTLESGREVKRHGGLVAQGSGMLGMLFPFEIMWDMIASHKRKSVLDIGCGDANFLTGIFKKHHIPGYGIDFDPAAVKIARGNIENEKLAGRIDVKKADMFRIESYKDYIDQCDCVAMDDVLHEYFSTDFERLQGWMKDLKKALNGKPVIIGEFCRQPQEALRKDPTAAAEHHFFHDVSKQKILTENELDGFFISCGFSLLEKRVFNMVGHGYFMIK